MLPLKRLLPGTLQLPANRLIKMHAVRRLVVFVVREPDFQAVSFG